MPFKSEALNCDLSFHNDGFNSVLDFTQIQIFQNYAIVTWFKANSKSTGSSIRNAL